MTRKFQVAGRNAPGMTGRAGSRSTWLVASALLAACFGPDRTTGGSVEENEVLAGTILTAAGDPVPDALVRVYPVDHVPGKAAAPVPKRGRVRDIAYSTRTDAAGRYTVDSLARGQYNILADKDGAAAYRDSVFLASGARVTVIDTLRTPGSLSGVVGLEPNHDLRTATAHVLGTHVFVNADAMGGFTLPALAEGDYRLRVETTLDGYTALFKEFRIESGAGTALPDTLRPTYTGIPVVRGLSVALDTLAGTVRVAWTPSDYGNLGVYLVYRDPRTSLAPGRTPIALTRDTQWVDTLYPAGRGDYGLASGSLPAPEALSYRVRVRDVSLAEGEFHHAAELDAVPPSWVRTHVRLVAEGLQAAEASIDDTARFRAQFRNKTRSPTRVAWYVDGGRDPVRIADLPGRPFEGEQILVLANPFRGSRVVQCRVFDEGGDSASAMSTYAVVAAPPRASAGSDTAVWRNGEVNLSGTATTRFGSIAQYEWDIGGTGAFQASPDGRWTFTAPADFATISCVLRVTNTDGETGLDTVLVVVTELWEKVTDRLPFVGSFGHAVVFGGRAWLIGGKARSDSDPSVWSSADMLAWRAETGRPGVTDRTSPGVAVFQDEMWILGGELRMTGADQMDAWSSADGVAWRLRRDSLPWGPIFWRAPRVLGLADRLMAFGTNGQNWGAATLPDGGAWTDGIFQNKEGWHGFRVAAFGGSLIMFGGKDSFTTNRTIQTSANGETWDTFVVNDHVDRAYHSVAVYDARLWAIGGLEGSGDEYSTSYAEGNAFAWHSGPRFPQPVGAGNVALSWREALWVIHEGTLWRLR